MSEAMSEIAIRPDMTMQEILRIAPAAQRALFQRYHVGGCSSCGFQPTDTLAQVCKERNLLDVNEVIRTIQLAHEMDQNMQVEPRDVKAWLAAREDFSFIDVRSREEWELERMEGAELLDYGDSGRYMDLPKERKLVFACQTGERSLDVAAYFKGHGFSKVYSMRGGVDAWRRQVGTTVPAH
jgi:rhodanese-related sulfurtransferase